MKIVQTAVEKLKNTFKGEEDQFQLSADVPMGDRESLEKLWKVMNSGRSYASVLEYVDNEIKESVRVQEFHYKLVCYLSDGAYALSRSVEKLVGFTSQKNTGPSGDQPPKLHDVQLSDGTRVKVPIGKMALPNFGEEAFVDIAYNSSDQTLHVRGRCQKKYMKKMDEVINHTQFLLDTDSIYKGNAIAFNGASEEPTFINISKYKDMNIFLTKEAQFNTSFVEARIERTEQCVQAGIDIKYGILLEGPYGTGKTLYAFKLAYKANQNGWTFIYCKKPELALEAMKMANRYTKNGNGVVLFIEDIDQILKSRDSYTNEISLLMDGGESKEQRIITILTTNHMDDIDPTFLRGKRISSVVQLTAPDAETAKQMMYDGLKTTDGISMVSGSIDAAAAEIEKLQIVPAFIAEIISKVKSWLILKGQSKATEIEIMSAIQSYQRQMDAAAPKHNTVKNSDVMYDVMGKLVEERLTPLMEKLVEIETQVENLD